MWRSLSPSCLFDFLPFLPLCAFSANLGIMGLRSAFHSRLWMSAQRPVAKKNKMAVKMQTLEVKKKKVHPITCP